MSAVADPADKLSLEGVFLRACRISYNAYASAKGYAAIDYEELLVLMREEAVSYLEKTVEAVKKLGVDKVSYVAKEGFAVDEIISTGPKTPATLITMCTHGRSGVRRWMLASVTETSCATPAIPVLVIRPG
jgi:nucleotide-binding universal stress UspA family protein